MEPLPIDPRLVILGVKCFIPFLCLIMFVQYVPSSDNSNLLQKNTPIAAILLSILLIVWMGMRTASGHYYGDSSMYRHTYDNVLTKYFSDIDFSKEWFFNIIGTWCKSMECSYVGYFLVIEIGYIGFMLIAYWRALWENVWLAVLFAFSAYSFFTYGTNGLRNGLACSMITAAIVFIATDKRNALPLCVTLCVCALGVHKSMLLPIASLIAALTFVKNTKHALYFWIASIPISLIWGEYITNLFASMGYDDRMSSYARSTTEADLAEFSHVGFRWDFLLYSSMPVCLISYVVFRRNIKDRTFHIISTVYLLCNAFWVMVCRSAFSNRFAYLSWFIYPLVIAYPLIRMPIWKNQDRKVAWALLAHSGFTLFMWLIGK